MDFVYEQNIQISGRYPGCKEACDLPIVFGIAGPPLYLRRYVIPVISHLKYSLGLCKHLL